MSKNYTISIKVSKEEKEKLQTRAEKCGLKIGQYLRLLGLTANIKEVKKL